MACPAPRLRARATWSVSHRLGDPAIVFHHCNSRSPPHLPVSLHSGYHFSSFTYGVILPHKRHRVLNLQIQAYYLDEYFLVQNV